MFLLLFYYLKNEHTYFNIALFLSSGPYALQERSSDCRCSLSCDGEPELQQLKSVHVLVERHSDTVLDKTFPSLYDGERCSVPGCFERDAKYTLKIYTHDDNEKVPKLLYDKPDVQPGKIITDLANV